MMFLIGAVSAASALSSDLQLHIGAEALDILTDNTLYSKDNITYIGLFNVSLENYNLWELGSGFWSVGFMENVTGSFGGIVKQEYTPQGSGSVEIKNEDFDPNRVLGVGFTVGPAFALCFGAVAKLQFMLGFLYRYTEVTCKHKAVGAQEYKMKSNTVGFSTGLEAKFLPKKLLSPVVGFRYSFSTLDSFETTYDGHKVSDSGDYKVFDNAFTVDLGLSINLSR